MTGVVITYRSLRCSYCNTCWPLDSPRYDPCPLCREPTEGSITQPIPEDTAEKAAREYNFGWYLWDQGLV